MRVRHHDFFILKSLSLTTTMICFCFTNFRPSMQEPCAIFVLFSHSVHCFARKFKSFWSTFQKTALGLAGAKWCRMGMTFAFRIGGMMSGEPVERAAVTGERGAGNECRGQRWRERGNRGKSERRGEPCGIVSSMLFLSFVLNFYFLKKTTTATFLILSSSDYQYDEYHQYH